MKHKPLLVIMIIILCISLSGLCFNIATYLRVKTDLGTYEEMDQQPVIYAVKC